MMTAAALSAPSAGAMTASRSLSSRNVIAAARSRRHTPQAARPLVVRAFQEGASTGETVSVTFKMNRKVVFGQELVLVGSTEQLGAWNPQQAQRMTWSEGHVWHATVELPAGCEVEYKFVIHDPRHAPLWESCFNRKLTVDAAATALAGFWNQPLEAIKAEGEEVASEEEGATSSEEEADSTAAAPASSAKKLSKKDKRAAARASREVKMSPTAEAAVDVLLNKAEGPASKPGAAKDKVSQGPAPRGYSPQQLAFLKRAGKI